MRNLEVARRFYEMAAILEILGEDRFRSLSYERAARQLEALPRDIEDLVREAGLSGVPGIGEALAEKIEEYLATGRIRYHEELRAKLPPGLLELLDVPGLGPKKVRVLWQQIGVSDLETLRKAAEGRRLRRIKGFGEKTEQNILRGIRLVREGRARTPLATAAAVAEAVVAHLQVNSPVERIDVAGSLRRMRETVGDIDVLAITGNRAAVADAFTKMPSVQQVLAAGETKATVLVDADGRAVQVDLRILDRASWGAGLQYFTGSKDHNVKLRGRAMARGLKLNEYGVFRGDERIAGETEEGVYRALDLPWIPPELREDQGEIESAATGSLPVLVDGTTIRGDLHVHTNATDGAEPLEAMVEAARNRGYAYVGIADHSVSLTVARGLTSEQVLARRDRIRALNRELRDIKVLAGTECDILDGGEMDYPDEVLKELDFAIASVHSKFAQPRPEMTARVIAATENPHVNILGHPTTRLIGARAPIELNLEEVFASCARSKTVLEINAYPSRMDLNDVYARAAKDAGCVFAVDTDSHASAHLDGIGFGVGIARRAWLTADEIVNAWPLERVQEFFR